MKRRDHPALHPCCRIAALVTDISYRLESTIDEGNMKLVKSIIRQDKLAEVVKALAVIVPGMTVSDVRGHGRQRGHRAVYRGLEYTVSLLPKVMVEIVIDDNKVDDVVTVLATTARTGEIGDGRIFISTVEESYHVRTGFMDR
jgi:nitrogen regulatory protein PII